MVRTIKAVERVTLPQQAKTVKALNTSPTGIYTQFYGGCKQVSGNIWVAKQKISVKKLRQ